MKGQDANPSRGRVRRWGIGAATTLTITIMVAASVDLTVMAADEKSAIRSSDQDGRSGQNVQGAKGADAPAPEALGESNVESELHLLPVAGRTPTVQVTNVGQAPLLPVGAVEEVVLQPNHPPLDQIPPMPMPRPEEGGVSASGDPSRIIWLDAKTGRTGIAPVQVTQQADFGTRSGYDGTDGGEGLDESDFGGVAAFVDMTEIANTTVFPWRMNVKVVMHFIDNTGADRWFGCSGTMIDAETVALAGHCVYARTANGPDIFDWAEEIFIYPGRHGSLDPYGWARGTAFASSTGWVEDGNFDWDWGLLRVTRSVGMLTGWFGTAWGFGCDTIRGRTYNNASYPGENCPINGLHNGDDMYYWYGTFDSCPGNQLQINTGGGNCFDTLWGGQSGSGAYYMDGGTRYVHAVASNSNRTTSGRYAKLWESMFDFIYDTFIPASRGNSFDLQALDANAAPASIPAGDSLTTHSFLAANPTNVGANGTWTVRWYLSTNSDISSADRLIGSGTFDWNFPAMSSVTVNVGAIIPDDVPPGNYFWGVELDAGTDVNSTNNSTDGWDAVPITVLAARPPNDDCGDATLIPSVPYDPPILNTSSAGSQGSDPLQSCTVGGANNNSNSVWYTYTPPCSGTIDVSMCGSDYDTVVAVYTGSCGNFAEVGCNDDSCGLRSEIIGLGVVGGRTLYIEVTDFGAPRGGNLDFHFDFTANVPPNDSCDSATFSTPNTTRFGTTCGATLDSAPLCVEDNSAAGVWYRVPGTGTMMTASTCNDGTDYDTKISVYCADCGTLPCVTGNDDDCVASGLSSTVSWCSQYGNEYLILVHGFQDSTGNFELTLSDDGVPCTGAVDCGGAEIGACCGADGGACLGGICGEFSTCDNNESCVCGFDTEGGGRCFFGGRFCFESAPCPNGSIDCPTGQHCWAHSCCGGPVCMPDCSAGSATEAGLEGGIATANALRAMGSVPASGSIAAAVPYECLSTTQAICLAADGQYLGDLTTCGGAAFVHRATVDNTFFNHTNIDHPLANGNLSAIVMATQNWNPAGGGGGFKPIEIGVWYNPNESKWSIFTEDNTTEMPEGSAFNVEILSASASVFVHTANTVIGHTTNIDHALTNGNPNAIVMVTQNWNPSGDFNGIYNDHPIGVWYTGAQWSVFNEDIAAMPQGASFNIEVLSASTSAFIHAATANNIAGHWTVINHPLTNGNPEALLHITQNWNPGSGSGGIYNVAKTSVWYDGANWAIFNENFAAMPDGASFNVKVLSGGTSCPDPVGACCIDGVCEGVSTEVECTNAAGTWFEGEDCATAVCPQAGACCAAQTCTEGFVCGVAGIKSCDGNFTCGCLSTIEGGFGCASVGNAPCGDACTASSDCPVGWVCAVDTCCTGGPAVCVLAQCSGDGTVSAAVSEVFASSDDETVGRIAGTGVPLLGCTVTDVSTCDLVGGLYQGDNTICTDQTCAAPIGACCVSATCSDGVEQAACNGNWFIHQDCSTVNCEQPQACCFATGGCSNMTRTDCLRQGGQPQGTGTDCRTHQCVSPEACCLSNGECGVVSPNECRERGGTPLGQGSECLGDRDQNGVDDACEFDQPCQDCGPGRHWIDECRRGEDVMPSGAVIGIDRDGDCVQDLSLRLGGPVRIKRSDPLDDSSIFRGLRPVDGHFDVIDVEMVSMSLSGGGVRMIAGGGLGQGGVLRRSVGAIAEQPRDDTLGDSFFDVFFEVELGPRQYAYNQEALRVQAKINCLPPVTTYIHPSGCIKLFDSPILGEGRVVAWLVTADHTTFPGCGDPSAGDCYEPHAEPYCNDQVCCETVCEREPRCCSDSWPGVCTDIATELCPLVEEACCLRDGRCAMTDRRTCEAEGGVPQGAGTDCQSIECPVPQEACCFPTGGCDEMEPRDCEAQGGSPQGAGTSCTSVTCPVPPEACCSQDGDCIDTAPVTCRLRNGVPQGPGTTCDTHRCPLPPQACCLDGFCTPLDPFVCRLERGVPQGPGTDCLGDANSNGIDDACDANTPCDECGPGAHWIHEPPCPPGADNLPSGAKFGIDTDLDCIADFSAVASGPATVLRSGPRDDSTNFPGTRAIDGHFDVLDTEIVQMDLFNGPQGIRLTAGAGQGSAGLLRASLGAIAEQGATPTLADSFFDVFFEIEFQGTLLYNQDPVRVDSKIDCIPPDTDYIHPTGCIPLWTSPLVKGGVHVANLVTARHGTFLDCGSASAGGCFESNGTPFCDEAECCRLVCEQNEPDCCGVAWNDTCAAIAQDVCVAPEACCLPGGQCISIRPADCIRRGGVALGPRTRCEGDLDRDGTDDACQADDQCEDCGPGDHWIDTCPGGNDNMNTGAKIGLDFTLDCDPDRSLVLSGPVSIWHSPGRDVSANFAGLSIVDGHFDVIDTEIVSMSLTNAAAGITLRAGDGMGLGGLLPASLGAIVEQPGTKALGDSFFDVFFEVDLGGGLLAYNHDPLRVNSKIDCLPPGATYIHPVGCIPLYDVPPGVTTRRIIVNLVTADHSTFPECGDDTTGECFIPNSTPYCDDAGCCDLVCLELPQCCDIGWDDRCATLARDVCRPTQACCERDTTCSDIDPGQCIEIGGQPQGAESNCSSTQCRVPPQACCLPGDIGPTACAMLSPDDCRTRGGVPHGPNTQCEGDANSNGVDDACEDDDQCEDCGPGDHWIDRCPGGNDNMSTGAKIGLDLVGDDCVADMSMVLNGPVSIWRSGPRDDSVNYPGTRTLDNHFDVIDTEMVALTLTNVPNGVTLRAGAGMGLGQPLPPSLGVIAEQSGDITMGDSFFDVFFEVDVQGQLAYNTTPLRVETKIDCLPPHARYIHPIGCIPLVNAAGERIGNLVTADHSTFPTCGDATTGDCFGPNGTPYCDDAACCERVCTELPHCCDVGWDEGCADFARVECGGECPQATIRSSSPADGTVDARQPSPVLVPLPRQGIGSPGDPANPLDIREPIIIRLDPPLPGGEQCFNLCETAVDQFTGPNAIQSVTYLGNGAYEIILRRAITAGAVTTIQYKGDGSYVEYFFHPANADANLFSDPPDILKIIDWLNGVSTSPWGVYSEDIDRSGALDPPDILRIVDLLNGAGAYDPWLNVPRPLNRFCPGGVDP